MRKKFIVFILTLVMVILVVSIQKNKEVQKIKEDVFASPRQLGEFILYGSKDNKFFYYKPVEDMNNIQKISRNLYEKINFMPIRDKKIFDYSSKEIYVVENKGKTEDETYQHVQIQYHKDGGNFIIFSAYEVRNFKDNFENLKEQYIKQKEDLFGNEVEILKLKDDMSYIHFKNTTCESLTYMYYKYNLDDSITLVYTVGDEILTYKEGILYHIAFNIEINEDVLVKMLNTFIR
ncbi:hypothetical protein [Abyssisolibacter fermentans]|uniref:hypothetical protein n=1 Tax=Abyssisolibacter fermentans TaxID=1766203 RepID=UPI000831F988|nr:hypothetical protein [Abyssisolibacter fermentans]